MFAEQFGRDAGGRARAVRVHLTRISRPGDQAGRRLRPDVLARSRACRRCGRSRHARSPRRSRRAHDAAVADTIGWLEKHAAYTRGGTNGVAQVDVTGLIAAAFTHRDSRAGDPDLHTHVAVSQQGPDPSTGGGSPLDGRALFKNNGRRLRALQHPPGGAARRAARGAVRRPRRRRRPGKRPVREIVGVDARLRRSGRRGAADDRRPTAPSWPPSSRPTTAARRPTIEALQLAQQATLETREAQARTPLLRRAARRPGAAEAAASPRRRRHRARWSRDARAPRHRPRIRGRTSTRRLGRTPPQQVLATVAGRPRDLAGEPRARRSRTPGPRRRHCRRADLDPAVDAVVDRGPVPGRARSCSTRDDPVIDEPAAAAPRGRLVGVHRRRLPPLHLGRGPRRRAAHPRRGGAPRRPRRSTTAVVDLALLEPTANGVTLNPGQAQMVRELATSGARVQLALAPAGTGKTTAMRVLSPGLDRGRRHRHRPRPVRRRGRRCCATRSATRHRHPRQTRPRPRPPATAVPGWMRRDRRRDASSSSTKPAWPAPATWPRRSSYILGRGGVGAAGRRRPATRRRSPPAACCATSPHPRRGHPVPGHALHPPRIGSTEPRRRRRLPRAPRRRPRRARLLPRPRPRPRRRRTTTVTDHAYTGLGGRPRRRPRRGHARPHPRPGHRAERPRPRRPPRRRRRSSPAAAGHARRRQPRLSAGDTIITRRNDRRLAHHATDWVKNGDRWTVDTVRRRRRARRHATCAPAGASPCPPTTSRQHVELGYACTVHAAQGITADTCHTVATGDETRQLLYVAMTRGRHANHVYLDASVSCDDEVPYAERRPATDGDRGPDPRARARRLRRLRNQHSPRGT